MRRKDEGEFVDFAHGMVAQLQRTAFLMWRLAPRRGRRTGRAGPRLYGLAAAEAPGRPALVRPQETSDGGGDPIWATYYDAAGNVIERVNANPASSQSSDVPVGDVGEETGCGDWRIQDGPTAAATSSFICREGAG